MDFWAVFCGQNSGQLDLWGPSYGSSKKATIKIVSKLGLLWHFLWIHFQMAITLVLNGQKFKSPAPSACYALALETESRSIGPQGLELWPCQDGNRQTISFKFEPSGRISSIHVQTRITLASSAWCALALGTRSRTIAALGSKLWSSKEGTYQRIYDTSMFKHS